LFFSDTKCIDDPEFEFLFDDYSLQFLRQSRKGSFRRCRRIDDECAAVPNAVQNSVPLG